MVEKVCTTVLPGSWHLQVRCPGKPDMGHIQAVSRLGHLHRVGCTCFMTLHVTSVPVRAMHIPETDTAAAVAARRARAAGSPATTPRVPGRRVSAAAEADRARRCRRRCQTYDDQTQA